MSQYLCSKCGDVSSSWYGKCPSCGEWNSLIKQETVDKKGKSGRAFAPASTTTKLSKISSLKTNRVPVGIHEIDRVLGGGFVAGEVILLSGEPGVGKSTLLLNALSGKKTLYVSGEESGEQIRHRADRLGTDISQLSFSDTTAAESIVSLLETTSEKFNIVVVDSIQTIYSLNITSGFGSPSQIKEATSILVDIAKKKGIVMIIVGPITKDGDIAGPKTLEHLVDCVLYLEGAKDSHFRLLRAQKNRFGSVEEVGVFEMGEKGMVEVANPTVFVDTTSKSEPGRVIVSVSEGSRSLFFEVQSLVVPTSLSMPRRVVSGVDYNKVQLLLAVIRKNLHIALDSFDVYVNVVGGISIKSPAADLGIVASVISSIKNKPASPKTVFCGEIGLLGEVRPVYGQEKVIKEATRFGFNKVYTSANVKTVKDLALLFK